MPAAIVESIKCASIRRGNEIVLLIDGKQIRSNAKHVVHRGHIKGGVGTHCNAIGLVKGNICCTHVERDGLVGWVILLDFRIEDFDVSDKRWNLKFASGLDGPTTVW